MSHHVLSPRSARGRNRLAPIGVSLVSGLALVAGFTVTSLAAQAGATTRAHVQRSASDLLKPRALIPFAAVHATFTVTNFGDDVATPANCPGANCSLRDAVAAANADTGNLDGIVIPSGNTVNLSNGVIDFTNSVLLSAAGATVNGGGQQIFNESGTTITVQITGGTLTNGISSGGSGGAFEQDSGALMLSGVTLTGNTASAGGALYSDGQLWISDSAFAANTGTGTSSDDSGGGIFLDSSSAAFIESTLFQGNGAPDGAGIMNWNGALTVNDSTFTGNNEGPNNDLR